MVEKKRRIAPKPTSPPPPAADDWVSSGGTDPEVQKVDSQTSERLNIQTSKHPDVQTSNQGKSSRADYKRTTVYLPKELHSRLKLASLQKEMEMSDIAEDAIAEWLDKHSDV